MNEFELPDQGILSRILHKDDKVNIPCSIDISRRMSEVSFG